MCNSPLHPLIQALPKCEHHIHIEGALTPALLFELASRNHIELPTDDAAYKSETALRERYNQGFASLDAFLKYYYFAMSALVTSADFEDLAWSYFQKAHQDGVVHAEVFFDSQAHILRGIPYERVISGLSAARARAERELGMSALFICCFLRHLPAEDALHLFKSEEVQFTLTTGIVAGIGLDSSEIGYPPELFQALYEDAHAQGINVTAHAGEEGPSKNIRTSIEDLHCRRIDHGVRIVDDAALMQEVAENRTLLTVCPLSNVCLRGAASVKDVPVRKFLDAGVKFSINSDDPAYFGGFILDNYCAVQEAHNLTVHDWQKVCTNAIQGSWCSEARKVPLIRKLDRLLEDWAEGHPEQIT